MASATVSDVLAREQKVEQSSYRHGTPAPTRRPADDDRDAERKVGGSEHTSAFDVRVRQAEPSPTRERGDGQETTEGCGDGPDPIGSEGEDGVLGRWHGNTLRMPILAAGALQTYLKYEVVIDLLSEVDEELASFCGSSHPGGSTVFGRAEVRIRYANMTLGSSRRS